MIAATPARAALTIARYTLLEALRNRLLWLLLGLALGAVCLSGFLNELALTESRQLQAALLGVALRLSAVFRRCFFISLLALGAHQCLRVATG